MDLKIICNVLIRNDGLYHREQTYGLGERGGEGEIYGESNIETYVTICKIDSQWEFAVCLRKFKQGLSNNLEGWDGEGGSRRRENMYTYG